MPKQTATRAGTGTIRVMIADDHAVVRDGLRALVEAESGLTVVAEASNGEEAWSRACATTPDVLLLDLSMPGVTGIEAAERITKDCPTVRILVLTMHQERAYVARLLRAGASGYVLKRSAANEVVRAIRAVASGGTYVDPSLSAALFAPPPRRSSPPRDQSPDEPPRDVAVLTPREAEVLRLVASGHTNKEAAAALGVSVKTIETHKANGMNKLGLTSRAALVRLAIDEGWLPHYAKPAE